MMLVDANLLIYAVDADSPHHARVRAWWEALKHPIWAQSFGKYVRHKACDRMTQPVR